MNKTNQNPFNVSSGHGIQKGMGLIFSDSVVLDSQYNFISISDNILTSTGYSSEELVGQPVSFFSHTCDVLQLLQTKLSTGFFEEEQIDIRAKDQHVITYNVSGCYLRHGETVLVVLKFMNVDEINLTHEKVLTRTADLDRFVYLSAHALRGPLATLKGLVNLARTCEDKNEMNFLLSQVDLFAEKLDDKLHRLIFFAESDKTNESPLSSITVEEMLKHLKTDIQEASVDFPVLFECVHPDQTLVLENGEVLLSLLRNLLTFFCQQPKEVGNKVVFDLHRDHNSLEFVLRAKGFYPTMKEKLRSINYGYSDILNQPELLNCYAAKKIVFKLKGSIQFMITQNNETVVMITLPRPQ